MRSYIHRAKQEPIGRGFTLLEVVIAVGFLSIAITTMLKMHQVAMQQDRNEHSKLRATMAMDNLVDSVGKIPHQDMTKKAIELAGETGVTVEVNEVEVESLVGLHLTFREENVSGTVVRHVWSFDSE